MTTIPLRLRRIHTLTNPFRLHRRLLSTFNSGGGGDPNLAIEQPSLSTVSFNSAGNETPSDASLITQLQNKLKQLTLVRNFQGEQLQEKWKQFEVNSENLKARCSGPDRQLSSEYNESRKASYDQIIENVSEFRRQVVDMDRRFFRQPRTREILEYEASTLITKTTDTEAKTTEGAKLLEVLSNSRLAIFDEMIENLSEIRKEWNLLKNLSSLFEELGNDEEEFNEGLWNELSEELGNVSWDELHRALKGCRAMELFDAKRIALETDAQLAYLKKNLKLLHETQQLIKDAASDKDAASA